MSVVEKIRAALLEGKTPSRPDSTQVRIAQVPQSFNLGDLRELVNLPRDGE